MEEVDSLSIGALQEVIDDLEDKLLKLDKRTVKYKKAVIELNDLFMIYNKKRGEKIYKLIK